jgi:hypothetical protein
MTPTEKAETRRDAFNEIITGYVQLLEIIQKGGAAQLTGHAYDPKESDCQIKLVGNLKKSLEEMRDQEAAKAAEGGS